MASAIGLVKLASPQEVLAEQDADTSDTAAYPEEFIERLARYVRDCWHEARDHKRESEGRFREAAYARRGEYTPQKLAEIQKTGASTEYARIIANKSRVLESWLKDVFLADGERPWSIGATPSPDLPEEDLERLKEEISYTLAQMAATGQNVDPSSAAQMMGDRLDMERLRKKDLAERRAERMEALIADQLEEGGFATAFADFLAYYVTYPGAVLKGPIFRHKDRVTWSEVDGVYIPEVQRRVVMDFEAVDPNNIFPAPGVDNPQDGYLIEYSTLTNSDLYALIGVDGYSEAAIRSVLDRSADGGYRWVSEADLGPDHDSHRDSPRSGLIDMLIFHGPVVGRDLKEWGMEGISDEQQYYEATVYLIDHYVIKAVLNDDPLGRRPYYKDCYENIPGEFWGYSMHDVLADVQGVSNAAIRSLCNNMAIASGPQAVVNTDRLPAGEDITNMYPWKIWQVIDGQFSNKTEKPIDFFQPNTNVQELLMVLEKFYALADDFSLIPRYMSGSDKVSGPGRTATGLSMLLDGANKGLKSIVQGIDNKVMGPLLTQLFDHNMIYSDDDSIKGDSQVMVRGVASLMQLETLRMRRNEFLQITNNPVDSQIVGPQGRASVLREIAKGLGMDVNKIVPPESQIAPQMAQQPGQPPAQPQQPGQPPAQPQQPAAPVGGGDQLANGAQAADSASPSGMMG